MTRRRHSVHRPKPKTLGSAASSGRPIPRWVEWAAEHGLWITLSAAAVVQLVHGLCVRSFDPTYRLPPDLSDMKTYWVWARDIAAGDWLSRNIQGGPFYYGPLYAYFLAVLLRVFGESYDAVHVVQGLIGLLPAALLWATAGRLFGKRAALATGLLAACCAPFFFYEQVLLTEGLLIAIHAAILLCLVRGQEGTGRAGAWALGGGVLSGMACWGRGNFFLVIPAIAAAWLIAPSFIVATARAESKPVEPPRAPAPTSKRRFTPGMLCAAIYLLGVTLALSATLWRNHHVSGRWVLTTTNGPILFYIGNAPDSTGFLQYPPSLREMEKQYGSANAVPWGRELLRRVATQPGVFVRLMLKKTWMFWNSYDIADNVNYYLCKRQSWPMRWSPVGWLTLVPLAVLGIMESRRLWRRQILLYVYTIGFALSIIAVFIVGRYRLEALLPMLVWSGPAAAGLAHVVWEQRWLNLTLRALALATGIGLLWPHGSPAARYNALVSPAGAQLVRPNDYDRLAVAYQKMGQRKEAVKLLEEALTAYPGFSLLTLRLADVHIEEGKKERAAAVLERFMANGWSDPLATRYLASIYATTGRAPQAVSLLQDHLRANPQDDQARTLLSQIQGGGK